ncbi:MAG: DNA gyrase inhibitor YacG [Immundisolibacteraceae bacterium]|nr:DNA gyrase inhibitor YacG [Immundisolibacteraceae bacterium]
MSKVKCPSCNKLTEWSTSNAARPFCSERCKMSDLNGWLSDEYNLNGQSEIEDQPTTKIQPLDPIKDGFDH